MKYKKTIFSIVTVFFWFSMYAYLPQLTNYAKDMGASYKLIGVITGAYGLSQTVLRIPFGVLSDALRKRKVFIIGGIISSLISAALTYFFPNPYSLLVTRLIAGIASATWVNFTILFVSYYKSNDSGKAISIVTASSKLGQLIAMFTSGFIAMEFGVRSIFLTSVVASVLCLIFSFFIYEEKVEIERLPISAEGLTSVMKNKRILHISMLGALIQCIGYSTNFGFTPLIAAELGASKLELGFLTTAYNLPQVLFSLLAGTIMSEKMGKRNALMLGFAMTTSVCLITPFAPNLTILYILQFIAGIGNAIAFSLLMAAVIEGVDSHLMTTTMGFYQAAFGVGMILGPMLLGGIGDYFNLTAGFIVVGLLGTFGIVSIFRLENE
ncbi:MFS transporter [Tissierellaceae bacterium HCP3S3_D8]